MRCVVHSLQIAFACFSPPLPSSLLIKQFFFSSSFSSTIHRQRANYRQHYLPWALIMTKVLKPLINVYWEQRWTQNIDELRRELHILPLRLDQDATAKRTDEFNEKQKEN